MIEKIDMNHLNPHGEITALEFKFNHLVDAVNELTEIHRYTCYDCGKATDVICESDKRRCYDCDQLDRQKRGESRFCAACNQKIRGIRG